MYGLHRMPSTHRSHIFGIASTYLKHFPTISLSPCFMNATFQLRPKHALPVKFMLQLPPFSMPSLSARRKSASQSRPPVLHPKPTRPSFFRSVFSKLSVLERNETEAQSDFVASYSRQGFGRQSNKGNPPGRGNGQQAPSPTSQGSGSPLSAQMPTVPHSPGPNAPMQFEPEIGSDQQMQKSQKPLYFFRDEHAGLIVKGNFMTLAAKPVHVEEGEWLAHQGKQVPSNVIGETPLMQS